MAYQCSNQVPFVTSCLKGFRRRLFAISSLEILVNVTGDIYQGIRSEGKMMHCIQLSTH